MDFRQLEYFVTVADSLSFTRAAEQLHISQPPLSRAIKLLEKELRTPLFIRTSRRVSLTPAGRLLAEEARRVLAGTRQFRALADSAARGTITPPVRITAMPTAFLEVVPDVVARLRQAHPAITVEVTCKDIAAVEADVLAGRADVGFTRGFRASSGLHAKAVRREPLVAAVSAHGRWAHQRELRVRDLAQVRLSLAAREMAPEYVDSVVSVCRDAGFNPDVAFEGSDYLVQLGMASSDYTVAIVPAPLSRVVFPGVVYLNIVDPVLETTIFVAQSAAGPSLYFDEIYGFASRSGPAEMAVTPP